MNRILYKTGYPLFLTGLYALSPFSAKIRQGLTERRNLYGRLSGKWGSKKNSVWFHVASSGELEQCLPLMDAVKNHDPDLPVFLSYFSPTAKRALELESKRRELYGNKLPCDASEYSPLDFKKAVSRYVDIVSPSHFVSINREIWPVLLETLKERGVRCCLFASYFSPETRKRTHWLMPWLKSFDFIGTTELSTKQFLSTLDISSEALGDPRVERVLRRKAIAKPAIWASSLQGQKIFLAASLWERDLSSIELGIRNLLRQRPDWRMILVPHEPKGKIMEHLKDLLSGSKVKYRLWSDWVQSPERQSHLIVDGVGQLAELYRYSTIVFVGGSFKAKVHNVLEPAAYGVPILTGPYIENSGEAMEMRDQEQALIRVGSPEEFSEKLLDLVERPERRMELSQKLEDYLSKRTGASLRYLAPLFQS